MPRKPLHPDCDGGIFCPVPGHVATSMRGDGRWKTQHVPLTVGQKRTMHERRMSETRARLNWIEARHGALNNDRETYADGTNWRDAHREWRDRNKPADLLTGAGE